MTDQEHVNRAVLAAHDDQRRRRTAEREQALALLKRGSVPRGPVPTTEEERAELRRRLDEYESTRS